MSVPFSMIRKALAAAQAHIHQEIEVSMSEELKAIENMLAQAKEAVLETTQWYAVSFGNGNDGVSQSHPEYYVLTNKPWELAKAAVLDQFGNAPWLMDEIELDGDAEFCISAVVHEGPNGETEFGAAYFIAEVFPVDEDDIKALLPRHDTMSECFNENTLALCAV